MNQSGQLEWYLTLKVKSCQSRWASATNWQPLVVSAPPKQDTWFQTLILGQLHHRESQTLVTHNQTSQTQVAWQCMYILSKYLHTASTESNNQSWLAGWLYYCKVVVGLGGMLSTLQQRIYTTLVMVLYNMNSTGVSEIPGTDIGNLPIWHLACATGIT